MGVFVTIKGVEFPASASHAQLPVDPTLSNGTLFLADPYHRQSWPKRNAGDGNDEPVDQEEIGNLGKLGNGEVQLGGAGEIDFDPASSLFSPTIPDEGADPPDRAYLFTGTDIGSYLYNGGDVKDWLMIAWARIDGTTTGIGSGGHYSLWKWGVAPGDRTECFCGFRPYDKLRFWAQGGLDWEVDLTVGQLFMAAIGRENGQLFGDFRSAVGSDRQEVTRDGSATPSEVEGYLPSWGTSPGQGGFTDFSYGRFAIHTLDKTVTRWTAAQILDKEWSYVTGRS